MAYKCSCGFTAASATSFYKHLSANKDSATGHQLLPSRPSNASRRSASNDASAKGDATVGTEEADLLTSGQATPGRSVWKGTQAKNKNSLDAGDMPLKAASQQHKDQQQNHAGTPKSNPTKPAAPTSRIPSNSNKVLSPRNTVQSPKNVQRALQRELETDQQQGAASTITEQVDTEEIHLDLRTKSTPPRQHHDVSDFSPIGALNSIWRMVGAGLSPIGAAIRSRAAYMNEHETDDQGLMTDNPLFQVARQRSEIRHQLSTHSAPPWPPATYARQGAGLTSAGAGLPAQEAVKAVEALLLWRNPWHSSRVLVAGLYGLVCYQQLNSGRSMILTPSTFLLGIAFLVLVANLIRLTLWSMRHPAISPQPGRPQITAHETAAEAEPIPAHDGQQAPRLSPSMQHAMDEELLVYTTAQTVLVRIAEFMIPLVSGGIALCYRALSGRRLASSALAAACLWLGMLIGELRLVSQPVFAGMAWIALFTIPCAYLRSRASADVVVEEFLRLSVRLLVRSDKPTLLIAGSAAGLLLILLRTSIIVRVSTALIVGFTILLYPQLRGAGKQPAFMHSNDSAKVGNKHGIKSMRIVLEDDESINPDGEKDDLATAPSSSLPSLPVSRPASELY